MRLTTPPRRTVLTAFCALSLLCSVALPVMAQDEQSPRTRKVNVYDRHERDAPPMRASAPKKEQARKTKDEPRRDEAPVRTININPAELERIGTLYTPVSGGLGIDVWYGSTRGDATTLIKDLPARTGFRTMQDLQRRLLLTPTDAAHFADAQKPPVAGEDLLTLRIEKLIEMGAYADAADLYRQIVPEPYHINLARNGVQALMLSGRGALACMEVHTGWDRFSKDETWRLYRGLCKRMMSSIAPNAPLPGGADLKKQDSAVIKALAETRDYRFTPESQKDIGALSVDDLAALSAFDAFIWDRFTFRAQEKTEPSAVGLLLAREDIDDELRFLALTRAVRMGNQSPDAIADLFAKRVPEEKADEGRYRLKTLYDRAAEAKGNAPRITAISEALALRDRYGVQGLLPFADMIAKLPPESFSPKLVEVGLRIMIQAGKAVPQQWVDTYAGQLSADNSPRNDLLLWLAAQITTDLSTKSPKKYDDLEKLFGTLEIREKALITALYKKLDRAQKLHNIGELAVYDNEIPLTGNDDYVMQDTDLTNRLRNAGKKKHTGEVIVLSSIVLNGAQPDTIHPVLLGEVLDGMKTVGLTKEARGLAAEVILGLSR